MKKYLAAISGGPDSIALLYKYRKKIIAVCCVNYHVRNDSENDVNIVKNMCEKYNIQCFVKDVFPHQFNDDKQNNFEAWARKIRYDFFVEISNELNVNQILIAHNFNDWLETAYMSLTRKSKALYYGIQSKNMYNGLLIKRPLLRFKKSTLQRFNDENKLNYAIDYTNFTDDYERNRVRKIINNWNQNELIVFKNKVDAYNKQNKKLSKKVYKLFLKWTKCEYQVNFLKKYHDINTEFTYYLLYKYLRMFLLGNINYQKIINIQDFIFSKNNPNISYRLGDNYILRKIKINKDWFLKIERN